MLRSDVRNLQTEVTECGLACLGMAAAMVGSNIDLQWLRSRYPNSIRGASLRQLAEIASEIGLSTRAVRCDPSELRQLLRPTILHWNMNHYVVLDRITATGARIFDPASGYRTVRWGELDRSFTGVALEIEITSRFQKKVKPAELNIFSLFRWKREHATALASLVVLSVFVQLYVMISPFYVQAAIDDSAAKGDLDLLTALTVGFTLFAIMNFGVDLTRAFISQRLSSVLSWELSRNLFHHMVRLPLKWFQQRRLADALSRFQALDPIKYLITDGVMVMAIDGVLSLALLVLMALYSKLLTLITLAAIAAYLAMRLACLPLTRKFSSEALGSSIAEQSKRLEAFRAIQTIKQFGGEALREGDWANKFARFVRADQGSRFVNAAMSAMHGLIDKLSSIAIVFLGVRAIVAADLSVGMLYAFMAYRSEFNGRMFGLIDQVIAWRLTDIYAFRVADAALTEREDLGVKLQGVGTMRGDIALANVSFRHAPNDPFVLRSVTLRVQPGETVAIAGPSGGGKSTLLKIICGLYEPSFGEITLDGASYRSWGLSAVRKGYGAVLQDDELLPGTIAENVAFFEEQIDVARVWESLEIAVIADEVRRLPMGLETYVGDQGAALSGGQKQRVLIARALYRRPKVLCLDEASSALDIANEAALNRNLDRLGVTRVIVAHRPQTILSASRAVHLDGGLTEMSRSQVLAYLQQQDKAAAPA